MSKSPDAFRTISEVADWLGIQTHVLRFWESKFSHIKPVKRAGGRRYYRPADMMLLGGIKKLLHDDGITIKGVQKILREKGAGYVSELSQSIDEPSPETVFDVDAVSADTETGTVVPFTALQDDTTGLESDDSAQIAMDLGQQFDPVDDAVIEAATVSPPAPSEPEILAEPDVAAKIDPAPVSEPLPVEEIEVQPRPIVVDIADPPASDQLAATPGILTTLPKLSDLGDADREEIASLASALKDWHDRATNLRGG